VRVPTEHARPYTAQWVCREEFRLYARSGSGGGGAQALIGPSHSVHGHGEARSRSSAPRACTGFYSAADTLAACAASSGGPEVGRETIPEPIAGPPPGRNGAEVAAPPAQTYLAYGEFCTPAEVGGQPAGVGK